MTDEMEPPADISWMTFETFGMSDRARWVFAGFAAVAAAAIGAAIITWLLVYLP